MKTVRVRAAKSDTAALSQTGMNGPVDRVHCLPLSEVVLYFVGELSPLPNPGLQFVVPPGTVDVRVLSCDIYNTKELI